MKYWPKPPSRVCESKLALKTTANVAKIVIENDELCLELNFTAVRAKIKVQNPRKPIRIFGAKLNGKRLAIDPRR